MSDTESVQRKSLSGRRPSFSSIRSRLRRASVSSKRLSHTKDAHADAFDLGEDDDQARRRSIQSRAADIPPVPPLPPHSDVAADHESFNLAYLSPNPARPAIPSSTSSSSLGSKRRSVPRSPSARSKQIPQESSLSPPLAVHSSGHQANQVPSARQLDAQDAFKETIPMTMAFFGGTVVAALFLARYSVMAAILVSGCIAHVLHQKLVEKADDTRWALEMEAAARRSALPGEDEESVEWLNKALATAWPLINSDYFAPFADLLEDSLMTQVPGIVHNVRVENMDQGSIPLRVKSFRVLPSNTKAFLQDAVVQAHKDAGHTEPDIHTPYTDPDDGEDGTGVDVGDFVNLEITFAYRGAPAKKAHLRSTSNTTNNSKPVAAAGEDKDPVGEDDFDQLKNMPTERIHMLLYLSVGLQKIAAVELPVWIEMIGIEGKARVRLQMTPVAPFVKHAAITFVGAPKLEISAKPLGQKMVIDAMNLPLMTSYVTNAVQDVIRGFIAPLSYTVDVAALLGAGDGPQDVYSVGVICFVLHQADDLIGADSNGQSDPFVQASFARAAKPLFTSRIVRKRRDAVWQETGFLLVNPDEVRDRDRFRLTVFDADRFSADDPLGKVEISIRRLMRKFQPNGESRSTNLLETRTDKLLPMRKGAEVQGTLKYSVGFFSLAHAPGSGLTPSRRKLLKGVTDTVGDEAASLELVSPVHSRGKRDDFDTLPAQPQKALTEPSSEDADLSAYMTGFDKFINGLGLPVDDAILRKRKERKERVRKLAEMIEGAKNATIHPPTAELPSGIVAFHIHSIANLEVRSTQRSLNGNSKPFSGRPRNAPTEESQAEGGAGGKLPSSYVQVFLNDEAIFRTRTKTLNPRPYINAGSERFVGDWTTARFDFTVRDARMRENDAILGCVGIRLADVLVNSSRSTEWYTLTGGVGYGKIRITLVFRSVQLSIPRPLRGWNVGVIEVAGLRLTNVPLDYLDKKMCHLLLETPGGKISTDDVEPFQEQDSGSATKTYEWPLKDAIRLPVRQRYPNLLEISLRTDSRLPGRHHWHAWSFVSLNRIADEMRVQRRLRLFETEDAEQTEQAVLRAISDPRLLQSGDKVDGDSTPKLLPVLEEMCRSGSANITDEAIEAANLRSVGWIEIDMIFHRGIAHEHSSCTAGDHELRYAYDTYLTLQDVGERPKPRTLKSELLRDASRASNLTAAGPSTREPAGAVSRAQAPTHRRQLSEISTQRLHLASGQCDEDEDEDSLYALSLTETELDRIGEDNADSDTPEGRRARARALHRNERGAAQLKGFRTLSWVKTNAEDGMAKVKRQFGKQTKRMGKMEAEGISHF